MRSSLPTRSGHRIVAASAIVALPAIRRRMGRALLASSVGILGLANIAGAQTAPAPDPDRAALEARLNALESKVQTLEKEKAELKHDTLNTANQVEEDASKHDLNTLRGITGDYTPSAGFVIKSTDGEFSLHPGLVAEFRNISTYRENIPAGGGGETGKRGDDLQNGFDVTRLRLTVDGTLTKQIGYFLQFQDDQGTTVGLLDAYVNYHFSDSPFSIKVGQFKDPVYHERNLSEARLLTADRSLVEALLGGGQTGRVQGVSLGYEQDRIRAQAVIHDGYNSLNTKFYDLGGITTGVGGGAGVAPTNFGVSGRGEYLVVGNRTQDSDPYKDYQQFTALGDKQDFLIVGAGFDYSQSGSNNVLFHTVDAQYNLASGWGFYAAYLGTYRDLNVNKGVAPGNYYDPGFQIQASYLVTPKLEPFVRYDYTYLASGSVPAADKRSVEEFTIGANYYIWKQNLKFTLDATWLPDGSPLDSDALGVLQDSGHNEFVLRAQLQLAI